MAFSVVAFGGVEWWGVAALEIGAAVLFLVWGMLVLRRRCADLDWNWLYLPMLGVAVLVGAQRIFGLSAYPFATKVEIVKGVALLVLCFLATSSYRTSADRMSFAWFLATLSFSFAIFGIAQQLAFDGKLYWLIPLPDGAEPFASFVNRDHYAGFVELTAPLALAMLCNVAHRKDKTALLVLFTIVPTLALLLSGSRGGILGFAVAILVIAILSRRALTTRRKLFGVLSLGILIGGLSLWLGSSSTLGRFAPSPTVALTKSQRLAMDKDTWKIYLAHPWTGTGLGTLETVYPQFASFDDKRVVDHAHNDYLEFLAEAGTTGGLLGAGFIAVLLVAGIQNWRSAADADDRAFFAGGLAACEALLVHSFADFNLHIPSNALLFLILATLACAKIPAHEPMRERIKYSQGRATTN